MNYSEQQQFFKRSRMLATAFAVLLIAVAGACAAIVGTLTRSSTIAFALTLLAMAISLVYTPNYLHLTVNPQKRSRWQIKIRWRLAGLVLVIGLLLVPSGTGDIVVVAAVVWLVGANLLATRIEPAQPFSPYFWVTDFVLLSILMLTMQIDLGLGAALLGASALLSVVICEKSPLGWASVVVASAGVLVLDASMHQGANLKVSIAAVALVLVSALETAWLVRRAQNHHKMNAERAMRELMDFTGYPSEHIWRLWSTSNQELAKNWGAAALDENNRERLAQWYRENSELYMFAISAYNLEYKRILSNLRMMRFGRGSCLDYGAGNGELILELARRRHPATYYDVEGETLKFARQRAGQRGLSVAFLHTKDGLAQAAQQHGFDTIFSFDVLEHLPDLPGELNFLSSLLNPGGLLVFDVPAGATKSHPMHLNHNLDVIAHMRAQGFREEPQNWLPKLPLSKQEKYLFRAPASAAKTNLPSRPESAGKSKAEGQEF
jgi:2-polyprenyl-3-methyl-5-hydroxy-6-metoxy-1,4-benzoquinol methylase